MNTSNFDTKQHFGFRKHRWAKGLASVLLGLSFVGVGSVVTGTNTVHADELGKADQANASLQEARDKVNSGSNTQTLGLNKVPNSGLRVQRFAAKPVTNDQDIEIDYDSDGNPIIPSQQGHPGDNYNVNVNYDADEHHTTIHYKDAPDHEAGSKDVSGYTDQTVRPGTSDSNTGADDKNATYDPNLPDGWKLKDGQKLPDISFSGNPTGVNDAGQQDPNSHNAQDEAGYNVSIEHNSGHLDHTKPGQDIPKPGDTIPGSTGNRFKEDPNNPGKVAGLTDKDLDKTISETIDIDVPEGYTKPASKTDSVQFSRGAKVDSVDGHVIEYDGWVASDGKNGKLADQTIDGIAGYVINVDGKAVGAGEGAAYTIVGPTVTGADGNIHHTVTYVAQGKVKTVDIVDKTDGSQNHSFDLSGNTDQTVKPSDSDMHLVDGLEFASDADRDAYDNLKSNGYKLTADDTSKANHIVINVQHHKITISTDKDIPADAISPDGGTTTKKITRTITVKTPNHDDRTTTDKTDTQTVTFTRTGTYDAVTKNIAWNNYTSDHPQFDEYDITAIPGYNVSVTKGDASELASDGSKLNAKTITSDAQNEALTVEYTGTAHETNYIFHDDIDKTNVGDVITAGGRTDQDFLLNGKTDESVNLKVPAGYKLVSVEHGDGSVDKTDQLPTDVTMSIGGKDTDKTVILHLTHDTRTITPGKDITPGQTIPGDHHNPGDTDPNTPLSYTDVHKSVTREYTIDAAPGQEAKSDKETLTFERTATIDLVNGNVTYTKWAPVAGSEGNFKNIDYLHSIDGYTTNYNSAQASDLNATNYSDDDITALKDGDNKTIHVTYDAQGAHQDYRFLDDNGDVVNMDGSVNADKNAISISEPGDNTGKTGDTYNKPTTPPAGWVLKDGETIGGPDKLVPQDQMKVIEVHVVHGKTTIKPGDLSNSGDTKPGDHSKPGDDKPNRAISYDDLHKELDRTITVNDPHTGAHTTTDKISFERTVTIDNVDGSVSFGDWTPVETGKNSFTEFDAPTVDGYTPSVAKVDGKTFTTNDDVDHWSDPNVKIDYTAKDAHQDYIFKDKDGKVIGDNGEEVPTGQTTSTTVTGKTDGNITKPNPPAGWEIVGGGEIGGPTKFMPDDTSTPVEVTVQHSHTVINPDDPKVKDPGSKISGNPDKKPGDGTPKTDISYDNLNTTITRTVTATDPKGAKTDLSQSIAYHRTATIDNVTGDVKFGDWTPVDPAKNSFTDVVVPTVPGYTPEYKKGSADDLKAETPTQDQINNWTNPDVQIGYTANSASKSYKFVDGNGKVINQDGTPNDDENAVTITVNGKTDEDIPAVNVPTGWELVNGQTIQGGKFTPGENDTQTIQIEHKILVIDPTNPQQTGTPIPDSVGGKTYKHVENSDLNSKATRQIIFNWPNGKVPTTLPEGFHLDKDSTNVVTQTIRFERYAHIDLVTGEVTYCDKNGKIADDHVGDPWDSDPNPAKFPALVIPKVAGYKAKVSLVQNKRTVNKQGLARMYQLFAVNFMALPASVPGDHTIGHEPVDPTKGDDGHKVAPKPGDTTIIDDKGGTRVIPGDTDPNKGQDHGTTNPDNPNKGKDEGNKGQDHGSTNPDNPNKGKDEGNKPNKGNDEGNKGKDEGSTTPVVPTTPSDSSNGQTPVQTPDQKPEDSDKPVDNSNNKGQGDKQDQNDQTENTKKTSKKTTKKNKKSAKDVNKVTREAKEKQREAMRKHPSSTGVGSDDGVLGSPRMGNNGPVAPTQDQAHMAPEGSPSATVQAATLGTHAAVSNSNNLPQTGEAASKLGLIGLAFASLGGIVALAGTRKRRED